VASRCTEPPSVATIFDGLLIGFVVLLATGKPALAPIAIAGGTMLPVTAAFGWLLLSRLARPLDRLSLDIGIIGRSTLSSTSRRSILRFRAAIIRRTWISCGAGLRSPPRSSKRGLPALSSAAA
jgi:hypothetical protein